MGALIYFLWEYELVLPLNAHQKTCARMLKKAAKNGKKASINLQGGHTNCGLLITQQQKWTNYFNTHTWMHLTNNTERKQPHVKEHAPLYKFRTGNTEPDGGCLWGGGRGMMKKRHEKEVGHCCLGGLTLVIHDNTLLTHALSNICIVYAH